MSKVYHTKESHEELINQLQEFYDRYGYITSKDFQNDSEFASISLIYKRFESWNNALSIAELPRNTSCADLNDCIYRNTEDRAYVFGCVLGDGCLYNNGNRYRIQMNVTDLEFAKEFGKRCCNLLDLKWSGWNNDFTEIGCSSRTRNKNAKTIYCVKKAITENCYKYMRKCCNINDYKSYISDFRNNKRSLLRGLWDSEGCINKNGYVSFSNTDSKIVKVYISLLADILNMENDNQIILPNTNISTQYNDVRISRRSGQKFNHKPCFQVWFPRKYNDKFYQNVNPTIKRKRERF